MSTPTGLSHAEAIGNLLRCWVREFGPPLRPGDPLVLPLPGSGTCLKADVTYWSATGRHRFGRVRLGGSPADPASVAALLIREASLPTVEPTADADSSAGAADPDHAARDRSDLVRRVLASAERVAAHLARPRPAGVGFLAAERSLRHGHPFHPAPKSREPLSEREAARYSPELGGTFRLHWFAADPAIARSDSVLPRPVERVLADLAGELETPPGTVLVPAHPWQAADLCTRPQIVELLEAGVLHDLGPAGPPWSPTSSLRTVYRPDAPVMLKLSLGLAITNSRRENLRKELHRGVEVARLLEGGLGAALAGAHPAFRIVTDPAWLGIDLPNGEPAPGLDLVVRDNPFDPDEDVACVAGLLEARPEILARDPEMWLRQYIRVVVEPVLWLLTTYGIGLEAHQQNTLVALDDQGMPVGGWYRDNQGYYFAKSRIDTLTSIHPDAGAHSDSVVDDAVVDERLGYYVGVNNLLGLIGGFGVTGAADERLLLAVAREELTRIERELGAPSAILNALLRRPMLRCKANLRTRMNGMDELQGPVDGQSVYVDIANPLTTEAA